MRRIKKRAMPAPDAHVVREKTEIVLPASGCAISYNVKKALMTAVISAALLTSGGFAALAQSVAYKVQPGDTYYSISQRYGVSLTSLMNANNATSSQLFAGQTIQVPINEGTLTYTAAAGDSYWSISVKYGVSLSALLSANNATDKSVLYIGQKVTVPLGPVYVAQAGDTYYSISRMFNISLSRLLSYNGVTQASTLYIGQKVRIPPDAGQSAAPTPASDKPYVTYTSYTVKSGDDIWSLSIKFGIPESELLKANGLTESSTLSIGQVLKVPVHHVPVTSTPGAQYGEYLDWWTQAQYVVPVNAVFEVVDFYTGKSFMAKRTTGANHADCETLTASDTAKMKEIWGGAFSWAHRPVLIKLNGRTIAASAAGMPHAGNDAAAGGVYTTWRSGDYGPGPNFDWVKGNNMDGHFDIHFLNSLTHGTGQIDPDHQANVKIAAGVK